MTTITVLTFGAPVRQKQQPIVYCSCFSQHINVLRQKVSLAIIRLPSWLGWLNERKR